MYLSHGSTICDNLIGPGLCAEKHLSHCAAMKTGLLYRPKVGYISYSTGVALFGNSSGNKFHIATGVALLGRTIQEISQLSNSLQCNKRFLEHLEPHISSLDLRSRADISGSRCSKNRLSHCKSFNNSKKSNTKYTNNDRFGRVTPFSP